MDLAITPISDWQGRAEKLLAVGFDVTERRTASEALRESRQMLRVVLDTIPQHVFWKDRESVYLGCNRNFAKAAGFASPGEVVGKTDFDFPGTEADAEGFRRVDREVIQSGQAKLRFIESQLMAGGERAWIETSKVPLYDAFGAVVGVLGTYEDITQRRAAERRIEYLAFHDGLTGLPNRSLLEDRLTQAIATADRHGETFAVLFADLDGFKEVNDSQGHDRGDEFLKEMAQRLSSAVRAGDTVARMGGDEFIFLLTQVGSRSEVTTAVDRLLEVIRQPIRIGDAAVSVTASIGAALFPEDDRTGETLVRHADVAMYHAKKKGRDGFCFYDVNMVTAFRPDGADVERVAAGFRDRQFRLLYQPIARMSTGTVVGAEALLRWNGEGPDQKMPGEFLPAIEGSDLIVEIGAWVLDEALGQAEEWKARGLDLRIAVNVAARQLQAPGFVDVVRGALERHPGVRPDHLELEILETAALEDIGFVQGVMARCRETGVRFCLDDFGTGYSSLSYLKKLPVDVVKIDQGFGRGMLEDREDLVIIESILSMSAILGRQVVAEVVENPQQGLVLLWLGCEFAQGFGIGRPMPGQDLAGWVSAWRPDPSWELAADTASWKVGDFALMVAAQEHTMWVEQVLRSARSSEPGPVLALGWNAPCRLGHWLEGPGKEKFERLVAFREACLLHQDAHEVASQIGYAVGSASGTALSTLCARLVTLRDGLLEQLGSFDRAVAGPRDPSDARQPALRAYEV